MEDSLKEVDRNIDEKIYFIPNIIHSSVPFGKDEVANVVVKEWGEKPNFSFFPRDHLVLGDKLGLFDFKRSVKMAGAGFPLYTGFGASVENTHVL